MRKKELGVIAFYLYNWLKHRNEIFRDGYDVPLPKLSKETGIKSRTLVKYMDLLKGHGMIDFKHNQEYFVSGAFIGDRKATTYTTNGVSGFSEEYRSYKKMDVQLRKEYFEMKDKQQGKMKDIKNRANVRIIKALF